MSNENNQRSRGVQSVVVSMQVLRAVAEAGGPAGLSEISQRSGMAAAKVHRYLVSLIESEMVVQRKSGSYDLGPAAAEVGIAAVARVDVINRAADALPELVETTACTAMLSVLGAMGPTVVRWERIYPPLITALGVGTVLPVLHSATGRAFLGWLPQQVILPYVHSEQTNFSEQQIEQMRDEVRSNGIAEAREIYIPGLYALAGPVLDMQGQAEAVVTLISTDAALVEKDAPQREQLKAFLGLDKLPRAPA